MQIAVAVPLISRTARCIEVVSGLSGAHVRRARAAWPAPRSRGPRGRGAQHNTSITRFTEMAAEARAVDPAELVPALLHLADLSNPVQPFGLSRRWAQCVCSEFREQARREKELGLPPTQHFASLECEEGVAKLQLGFIDVIAAPLWRAAALVLPGAAARVDALESNRLAWQRQLSGDGTAEDATTSEEEGTAESERRSSHGDVPC